MKSRGQIRMAQCSAIGRARLNAVMHWLDTAKPGDRLAYYNGFLMTERGNVDQVTDVVAMANLAMTAYKDGRVHLVQRRLGDERYEYLMERRPNA